MVRQPRWSRDRNVRGGDRALLGQYRPFIERRGAGAGWGVDCIGNTVSLAGEFLLKGTA